MRPPLPIVEDVMVCHINGHFRATTMYTYMMMMYNHHRIFLFSILSSRVYNQGPVYKAVNFESCPNFVGNQRVLSTVRKRIIIVRHLPLCLNINEGILFGSVLIRPMFSFRIWLHSRAFYFLNSSKYSRHQLSKFLRFYLQKAVI